MSTTNSLQLNKGSVGAPHLSGVALLGLEQGLENSLRFFFSARCRDRFYVKSDVAQADMVIIDIDSSKGKQSWTQHVERHPERPAILLSLDKFEAKGAQLVSKPVQASALQKALDTGWKQLQQRSKVVQLPTARIPGPQKVLVPPAEKTPASQRVTHIQKTAKASSQNHSYFDNRPRNAGSLGVDRGSEEKPDHAFIGSAPDIDPKDPQQTKKAQFDPRKFLVARVLRAFHLAEEKGKSVSLKHDRGSISLFPGDRRALVWMQNRHLRSLAVLPVDDEKLSVSVLDAGPDGAFDQNDPQYDLDALVWKLTLMASRGRFPVGVDPHAPVTLKHWPNLSRLQSFPHALRIAALWSRESLSLLETAKELDIPQRYVFAFYSAASMIGLVTTAQQTSMPAPVRGIPAPKHEKRRLLARIIQHLKLAS